MAERIQRRLAAVLSADVVGYSRLMGLDETGTLLRLNTLRREVIDPTIAGHSGRIVKLMGDGALVEFASAVDAVCCAIEIQRKLRVHDAGSAEADQIQFRIGINVGDVIIDGEDILGDGVNVAARVESVADPGGIAISENVWQQVHGKVTANFVDAGEQNLKNIARAIRIYRVEIGAQERIPASTAPVSLLDTPSIAVLPFQNMSGDAEQEYFADGVVEDIITGLSRIRWLFVIARNSSFAYKGQPPDIRKVGRELGVRYVLEGSVRKAAGRVRITTQLIEAETNTHIWAERYDRAIDDIFAVQDDITMSTVAAIEPSLRQAEIERVKRKRPDSLDAYDLVLRSLPQVFTLMPDGALGALPLLERAIALEPDYATALAYAAWCHEILFVRAGLREENRLAMSRYARAALLHGRDDAIALAVAGFCVGLIEHDRETAFKAFDVALALSPSSAFTYMFGSTLFGWAGDADRAISWGDRGVRLSPFDPLGFLALDGISLGHFVRGRFAESAEAARRAIQVNPLFSINYMCLVAALSKLGQKEEAKSVAARLLELQPSFSISRQCATVGVVPSLAAELTEAVCSVGLPA
jgi:adenylate cyclase